MYTRRPLFNCNKIACNITSIQQAISIQILPNHLIIRLHLLFVALISRNVQTPRLCWLYIFRYDRCVLMCARKRERENVLFFVLNIFFCFKKDIDYDWYGLRYFSHFFITLHDLFDSALQLECKHELSRATPKKPIESKFASQNCKLNSHHSMY